MVLADNKEFLFDTTEIAFDKLNPMVTGKGYFACKVPEGLKGEIFYEPVGAVS
ncbi:MAG: hypothetical protein P8N18_05895 [Hellea sp.]|nr:hypothetical protein [Hellea sp.]